MLSVLTFPLLRRRLPKEIILAQTQMLTCLLSRTSTRNNSTPKIDKKRKPTKNLLQSISSSSYKKIYSYENKKTFVRKLSKEAKIALTRSCGMNEWSFQNRKNGNLFAVSLCKVFFVSSPKSSFSFLFITVSGLET